MLGNSKKKHSFSLYLSFFLLQTFPRVFYFYFIPLGQTISPTSSPSCTRTSSPLSPPAPSGSWTPLPGARFDQTGRKLRGIKGSEERWWGIGQSEGGEGGKGEGGGDGWSKGGDGVSYLIWKIFESEGKQLMCTLYITKHTGDFQKLALLGEWVHWSHLYVGNDVSLYRLTSLQIGL
jgi:hypothetical protein